MEQIIAEVVMGMVELDSEQISRLKVVLSGALSKYEITEKNNEVVIYDGSNLKILNMFIAWKLTEGKSKRTLEHYKYVITKMIENIPKSIRKITDNDIFMYFSMLKGQGCSNVYIDGIRLCLSSFFGWCLDKEFVSKNPMKGVSSIKTDKVIKKPFTDEEMERLRQSCETLRDKALVEFLYCTGVRVSECISVNIKDIDFNNRSLVVYGKGAKEREVYLSSACIWHLKKYLNSREDVNEALFVSYKKQNKRLSASGIQRIVKTISKKAQVSECHPHRFRRTLATNLLKKGMKIEEVSALLGHEKLETTMIYCTVTTERIRHNYMMLMCA